MSVARTVNNWISNRRAMAELGRLDSRSLRDIGITRDEIPEVVRRAAR